MATIKVPTAQLPKSIQQLIKTLREGAGRYTPAELTKRGEIEAANPYAFGPPHKAKRYAPREVEIAFVACNTVPVNVAGFSFNAAASLGGEVRRDAPEAWQGSDGESNYTTTAHFAGPTIAVHGYNARDRRVTLTLPIGLDPEASVTNRTNAVYDCRRWYAERQEIDPSTFGELLTVAVDSVLAGGLIPFEAPAPELTDFAVPEGVSERARRAAILIRDFAKKHGLEYTGGCKVFRSPAEWAERGEQYGKGAELITVYEGAEVARVLSLEACAPGGGEAAAYKLLEQLGDELAKLGLYHEECTSWHGALYATEVR